MLEFGIGNKVILSKKYGSKLANSWINKLLCISYYIYESFDLCVEFRSILLNILKTFEDISFKGNQNGLSAFFKRKKIKCSLNGEVSTWKNNHTGIAQVAPVFFH